MRKLGIAFALFAALVLCSTPTPAAEDVEQGFDAQLFRPSLFGGNFIAMEDADTLKQWEFGGSLLWDYADSPYRYYYDTDENFDFISELHTIHFTGAIGFFDFLSLGVELPFYVHNRKRTVEDDVDWDGIPPEDRGKYEGLSDLPGVTAVDEAEFLSGSDISELETEPGVGDIRAEIKLRLLQQQKHWLGMALGPYITFPTGDRKSFLGEGRVTGGATLAIERDLKIVNLGLNGGYQFRGEENVLGVDVGDALKWGAGLSRGFDNGISFSLEYFGTFFYTVAGADQDYFHTKRFAEEEDVMYARATGEVMFFARYQFGGSGPRAIGGAGVGTNRNEGTPVYRVLAGVDYYREKPEVTKGKLVVRTVDQVDAPITAGLKIVGPDGNELGVSSYGGKWSSSMESGEYSIAATKEGYLADSTTSRVSVGETSEITLVLKILEAPKPETTLTIVVVEAHTGDKIGSVIIFNEGTSKQKTVKSPTGEYHAEWQPGYHKIVVSAEGYLPVSTQIVIKGEEDNQVEIKLKKKIAKLGKIYFATGSAVIKKKSYSVLNDVVETIAALGTFHYITIEGHTDNVGGEAFNMKLSRRRAQAVKNYLAKKGIVASKLRVVAYGSSKPIASNDSKMGRDTNRRVEFIIE